MRSKHVDDFNHDPWAAGYDQDVRNEEEPIRAGYADVLAWTVRRADIGADSIVVDLGSGTGNTSAPIDAVGRLICVDVSEHMTERARPKLAHLANVEFVQADLGFCAVEFKRFSALSWGIFALKPGGAAA